MPIWSGLGFQDGRRVIIEQLSFFHDHSIIVLVFVSFLVFYFISLIFNFFYFDRGVFEGHEIEFVWTIIPSFMLFFIAFPSLKILYFLDEEYGKSVCYKVIGHQWYWSYEYSDFLGVDYDSFISNTSVNRLLDTDNYIYRPYLIPLRFLLTSGDVIHSWTVPRAGVKCDALPGRLNRVIFILIRPGLYYGQCSELCGANHSFIPISLEAVSSSDFLKFLEYY